MASASGDQTESGIASSITTNNNHLKQKRARSQLSCTPCRAGKLKCNREKPACDQCLKRGRESQCLFVPPPVKHKPVQNVKGRIRQLEELVVDLMNQNRTAPQAETQRQANGRQGSVALTFAGADQPTPPSDGDASPQHFSAGTEGSGSAGDEITPPHDEVDAATPLFGQMRISKDEISYVGESHWGAILDSISDLKRDLADDEDEEDPALQLNENPLGRSDTNSTAGWQAPTRQPGTQDSTSATSGLGFMLGSTQVLSREELLAGMPEKRVADRLLSLWFNSPDPFKGIVHAPTFQDEYKRFWRSPKDTPTMWLGLMFAIMSLAASFGLRDVDPTSTAAAKVLADVNRYHALAASAAVLADFTKPKEHTIECLIVYTAGLRSNNAFVNVWVMIGLIVRLALRMGYHRDAKHYPNITPFQGEMRRRIWSTISMVDCLISFQLGLPSMVKTIQSDTQPPRNLLDRDFSIKTTDLPPSRSVDELTPSSYTRAKLGLTNVFANAAELSHATVPPAYEELMQLDRQLEEAKAAIPPLLQMPEISELVTDPAEQLMCRFNLDLLYLKTKTVLHRRYMLTPLSQLSDEEQKLGIGRSRKTCTECALRVLQHHHTIYQASQPGGQLESVKWYMGSISTHDFLLAAMIICLEMSQQIHTEKYLRVNPNMMYCPRRGALMEALEKSQKIWADASRQKRTVGFAGNTAAGKGEGIFDETEKAARAMGVMIEKVRQAFGRQQQAMADASAGGGAACGVNGDDEAVTQAQWASSGSVPRTAKESGGQSPFQGVVGMYDWADMSGVPPSMSGGEIGTDALMGISTGLTSAAVSGNSAADATGGSAAIISSTDTSQNDPFYPFSFPPGADFAMIGDILDSTTQPHARGNEDGMSGMTPNIDWEMWDNEITNGGGVPQEANGAELSDRLLITSNDTGFYDAGEMRFGNAAVGGTGLVSGNIGEEGAWLDGAAGVQTGGGGGDNMRAGEVPSVIPRGPSDVAFAQGTSLWGESFGLEVDDGEFRAAGDGEGGNAASGGMDLDMSLPYEDVQLEGLEQNYNRYGMYPATKEDWAHFWQRKRTGMTPQAADGRGD